MTDETIRVGDVCLDLAQGRPVQAVRIHDEPVGGYDDFDLIDNYANARLGTDHADSVVDVVYVGNIRSEPSKVYAFPTSRLVRIEVEAASDTIWRVQDEWTEQLLVGMLTTAGEEERETVRYLASMANVPVDVFDRAVELADVERRAAADGGDSQ